MVLIQREIHVIDGLSAKTLIGIDIMKPEGIIIDLIMDIMTMGICQSFRIPIIAVTKSFRTNAAVYCIEKIMVPVKPSIAVFVAGTKLRPLENRLPDDRDFFSSFKFSIHFQFMP